MSDKEEKKVGGTLEAPEGNGGPIIEKFSGPAPEPEEPSLFQKVRALEKERDELAAKLEDLSKASHIQSGAFDELAKTVKIAQEVHEADLVEIERLQKIIENHAVDRLNDEGKLNKAMREVRRLEEASEEQSKIVGEASETALTERAEKEKHKKSADQKEMDQRNAQAESKGLKHELKRIALLVKLGAAYQGKGADSEELTSLIDGAAGRGLKDEA